MRFEDFEVGSPFYTASGTWVCTDKGSRVVVAIKVDEHDASWLEGPPYLVPEAVFDEKDQERCWLDDVNELQERLDRAEMVNELPISHDVMMQGFSMRLSPESRSYPYPRLLQMARHQEGRILQPQAARRTPEGWEIMALTPEHTLVAIPEAQFKALPLVPHLSAQRALAKQR